MNSRLVVSLVAGGLMVMSAAAAKYFTPTAYLAQSRPATTLEQLIPTRVGGWVEEKAPVSTIVDPQIAEQLRQIYTQIVTRTYVNAGGERIMLSIAYGKDQSDNSQVHYPEVCYPAQGFQVTSNQRHTLTIGNAAVPVKQLETNLQQQRYEPITYWTTVGDRAVTSGLEKKMAEMSYGFRGAIPDGLLFRVSSIDRDSKHAFTVHEDFVRALAGSLDPTTRKRIMGIQ